jgi:hypothetical protein
LIWLIERTIVFSRAPPVTLVADLPATAAEAAVATVPVGALTGDVARPGEGGGHSTDKMFFSQGDASLEQARFGLNIDPHIDGLRPSNF